MKKDLYAVLKTKRLFLRPLELKDADLLWPDITDPEISKYMAWEAHIDKEQTIDFIKGEIERRNSGKGITWVIFKDDNFCGIFSIIALMQQHRALIYNKAEIAYWLSRQYQGQGIMLETGHCILQYCFQELGLHKICVSHISNNVASEKLIKRLGFRYIGEQIEEYQKKGVWFNQKNYELLDREYFLSVKNSSLDKMVFFPISCGI